jgi:hypothetical protein
MNRQFASIALLVALLPASALAHAGSQGLILLLPTTFYITAGGIAVLATVILAAALNHTQLTRLFTPKPLTSARNPHTLTPSLISMALFGVLIWIGLYGPNDPLANLMSLTTWTLFWVVFVLLCGVFGNLWTWLNPWSGLYDILMATAEPPAKLPCAIGYWPAILLLFAFNAYGISNPAATDPIQLAILGALYWIFTFLMMVIFGREWLVKGEFITVFITVISHISPFTRHQAFKLGFPGWRIANAATPPLTLALFSLTLLGTGTFDGFNETFFWLAQLGLNPLEFPGRSAIVTETVMGLFTSNILLIALFYGCIHLTTPRQHRAAMFARQSLTILPIAFVYHFAHFLPSLLVDIQYVVKALADPFKSGADYLGLGQFYVTTGFFNTLATQKIIFLTEAGAIVCGHILAILLSHRIAADYFPTRRGVLISQIPLSVFMIGYTVLGLWLLATPKGA